MELTKNVCYLVVMILMVSLAYWDFNRVNYKLPKSAWVCTKYRSEFLGLQKISDMICVQYSRI